MRTSASLAEIHGGGICEPFCGVAGLLEEVPSDLQGELLHVVGLRWGLDPLPQLRRRQVQWQALPLLVDSGWHAKPLGQRLVEGELVLIVQVMPDLALHSRGALPDGLLGVPPHRRYDHVRVGSEVSCFGAEAVQDLAGFCRQGGPTVTGRFYEDLFE